MMKWEQKLAALKAIAPTHLEMRKPGDWYVSASDRELKNGGVLISAYGNGETPEQAVNDDWQKVVESGLPIIINAYGKHRRTVRWNGFMWERELADPVEA